MRATWGAAAALAWLLAACGGGGNSAVGQHSSTPGASSSTSASSTSMAEATAVAASGVVMTTASQGPYHLAVLSTNGHVARSASAAVPSAAPHLPRFSVAGADVYYLDGNANLEVLK